MARPSLSDLLAFAAVANHRSFRRAADELGMAPSTLSHALRALEERLGVRLLHRTTRSVAPTEAGYRLLERLGPALELFDHALEAVTPYQGRVTGTIRLNAPRLAAALLVRDVLPLMAERFPEVIVDIVAEDRLIDVVGRGFDAGVRPMSMIAQDMVAVAFASVRYACVASPAYLERAGVPSSPEDLARHRCIGHRLPGGRLYRWEFERHDERMELDIAGGVILDDEGLMVDAAVAGLGVAYAPVFAAAEFLRAGALQQVLFDWTQGVDRLALYYPGHRTVPPALRAFVDVAKSVDALS
ncbi:LysR family transcriptional regulator [Brevundimonas sp. LM2]|uniref:LysR family transcriptional regulator n=1 Tax=Brevundimonas sp. LM2 TaxID=1938605 RepID=UPI000983E634|nr:LysR family transcriptional regulator [Brevundimonas sp. LM2]AQR61879.1 LysR family transcriptional regulator [Brevundimonas sp. LM2]